MRSVRIALGGVAHKPWRALEAERMLEGRALDDARLAAAAKAAVADARPQKDNAFKERSLSAPSFAADAGVRKIPQSQADKRHQ